MALSLGAGLLFGLGIMGSFAVRAAITITLGHRWYQLKKLY
jgi:hypothetical protein